MRRKKIVTEEKSNPVAPRAHVPPRPGTRHNRAKLLVSVVNRGDDEVLAELINDFSVALSFTVMGKGTARSTVLNYLGIGTSEKAVMFSVIPESDEEEILHRIRTRMELYLVGRGISFTIPLSAVSELVAGGINTAAAAKSVDGRKIMKDKDRKYDLIVAIVAAGYADEAMEAARSAGAAGGTIINSRSVNNAKAEQFIGISLREESDMLLILSQRAAKEAIMNAIMETSGLKTEAGGVLYSLPVDHTAGVGAPSGTSDKQEEENVTSEGPSE